MNEIILNLRDIQFRTAEELVALGKSLSHVRNIIVLGDHGHSREEPFALKLLRSHIGGALTETYDALLKENMPVDLIYITLQMTTSASTDELKEFFKMRSAAQEEVQEFHSFKFRCLGAFIAVGAIMLTMVVAMFFVPFGGQVGLLLSSWTIGSSMGLAFFGQSRKNEECQRILPDFRLC